MKTGPALILEDNLATTRILRKCLLAFGYAPVHDARDIDEALTVLGTIEPPVLCLVDYHLGGPSGLDFISKAKETLPGDGDTKFVVVTADASAKLYKAAMAAGADALVVKPFTPESLGEALANLEEVS